MLIYTYSACSTCKAALKFLEEKKIVFKVKEITKEPPSYQELEAMLKFYSGNIKKLLNTSGLLYKEMQLSQKIAFMPLEEIFSLLSTHGMLVKRPFFLGDAFGLTGFKEEEWKEKF